MLKLFWLQVILLFHMQISCCAHSAIATETKTSSVSSLWLAESILINHQLNFPRIWKRALQNAPHCVLSVKDSSFVCLSLFSLMSEGGKEASSDGLLPLVNVVESRLAVDEKHQHSSIFVHATKLSIVYEVYWAERSIMERQNAKELRIQVPGVVPSEQVVASPMTQLAMNFETICTRTPTG